MKSMCFFMLIVSAAAVFAQPGKAVMNEDVTFIKSWARTQAFQELVPQLNLSADQVTGLKSLKSEIDSAKQQAEARRSEIETAAGEVAAEIRGRLEAGGTLSETDRATMRGFRESFRELRSSTRRQMADFGMAVKDVLSEEQAAVLIDFAKQHRPEGMQAGKGRRGMGGKKAPGARTGKQGRSGHGEGGQRGARLFGQLLSDEFQSLI